MDITYQIGVVPAIEKIINLYQSSGINRPVVDFARIEKMYQNSNLVVTAWDGDKLAGISRALTDFSYCCYLSDLAVSNVYQRKGIGQKLIQITREQAGPKSMLLLLAPQGAMKYFPKQGFLPVENGFIIRRSE